MKNSVIAVDTTVQEVEDMVMSQGNAEVTDSHAHNRSGVPHTGGEPQGEYCLSRCCVHLTGKLLANLLAEHITYVKHFKCCVSGLSYLDAL